MVGMLLIHFALVFYKHKSIIHIFFIINDLKSQAYDPRRLSEERLKQEAHSTRLYSKTFDIHDFYLLVSV